MRVWGRVVGAGSFEEWSAASYRELDRVLSSPYIQADLCYLLPSVTVISNRVDLVYFRRFVRRYRRDWFRWLRRRWGSHGLRVQRNNLPRHLYEPVFCGFWVIDRELCTYSKSAGLKQLGFL